MFLNGNVTPYTFKFNSLLPGPPGNITDLIIPANMTASNSFVAQWSEPSSDPVCGTVQYIVTVYTGGTVISNDTFEKTNFTATNLSDDTAYSIDVTPINNGGAGISASAETTTIIGGKNTYSATLLQSRQPLSCMYLNILHCITCIQGSYST